MRYLIRVHIQKMKNKINIKTDERINGRNMGKWEEKIRALLAQQKVFTFENEN